MTTNYEAARAQVSATAQELVEAFAHRDACEAALLEANQRIDRARDQVNELRSKFAELKELSQLAGAVLAFLGE